MDCFFLDKDLILNFEFIEDGSFIGYGNLRLNFRIFVYILFMLKWNIGNELV